MTKKFSCGFLYHLGCPYLPSYPRCNLPGPEWLNCLSRGPFDARITTPALLFTVPFASTNPDPSAGIIDGVSGAPQPRASPRALELLARGISAGWCACASTF